MATNETLGGGTATARKKPGRKPRASAAALAGSGAMKDAAAGKRMSRWETMTSPDGDIEIKVRRAVQHGTANGARSGTNGKARSRKT